MKAIKKISIIGVGFMGGSLSLALRQKFPNTFVCGYARSTKTYNKLKKLKILDSIECDLESLVKGAEIVILSLPVEAIVEYFKKITPFLDKGAIVFDLGSSKKDIDNKIRKILPRGVNFVGCHPLCGSEKSGAQFSRKDLYKGSVCFITSPPANLAAKKVKKIWEIIGSVVVFISPDRHDKILSAMSHLPHLISFSLTQSAGDRCFKFYSQSFRDLTRISSSPSSVWADIFISNRKNILRDMNDFIKSLKSFERLIKTADKVKIINLIKKINSKQNCIVKGKVSSG